MSLMRRALLWCSDNPWMRRQVPRTWFVRRAVRRFMPGESLEAALTESQRLKAAGVGSILTQLGENISTESEADAVAAHYHTVLAAIGAEGLDTVISVKPTQLGLDLDRELACRHVMGLAAAAKAQGTVVWLDMEQSGYVDATLDLVSSVRREQPNIGVCLQAYLYRTADDVEALLDLGVGVRLVKGAYAEPRHVAFQKKRDVDQNFLAVAERLLERDTPVGVLSPAFATHDDTIIRHLEAAADQLGLGPDRYQFQMLYGIGRSEQDRLTRSNRRVMVLISYGTHWYPWYVRRLAERPANLWFVVKSLVD